MIWLWPVDPRKLIYLSFLGVTLRTTGFFLKLILGNCLPGMLGLVWTAVGGKTNLTELWSTLTNWRVPVKWYALAIVLPCSVLLASLWVASFFVATEYKWPPLSAPLKTFVSTLPFGTLWEEIAWRAYTLRKLRAHFSRTSAALLLGAYWSIWHIPFWLLTLHLNQFNRLPVLLMASINLTAWSVTFAYIYEHSSESLPVTMVLHGVLGASVTYVAIIAPQTNLHVIIIGMILSSCIALGLAVKMKRDDANAKGAQSDAAPFGA